MEISTFVQRWGEALEKGSASVFIGAGLSRAAGYPDWKTLLKDVAAQLGLDIEDHDDLAAVAQYSINQAVGKRHELSRLIAREFPPKAEAPQTFRYIARLPIRHIWTTNYDSLPETAWRQERKQLDVKSKNEDLGVDKPWAHSILYKMHGSVDHPGDVVIAKDDYELYRKLRPGFVQLLTGHLVSKQFLFLGFSFTDLNIAHLFSSIRESFRDNGPEHYAIVRRPQLGGGKNAKKRHKSECIRHKLWVDDLRRYGIQCVEIDTFDEIEGILSDVETRLARRNIMVAGSYPETLDVADLAQRRRVESVARGIGAIIAKRGKRLVSGFGLVVGSAAISGALGVVLQEDAPNLDKSLALRPFPQEAPPGIDPQTFRRRYREGMVQQSGVCILISGEKDVQDAGHTVRNVAEGALEEAEIALQSSRAVIPIGSTGGAAYEIWRRMDAEYDKYWPRKLRSAFNQIGISNSSESEILRAVEKFLDHLDLSFRKN